LPEVLVLLGISILIMVVMQRMQLSPVLGYLVVGAALGHYSVIREHEYTSSLSEFGVVFLLFMIGLELSFERLMKMRLHVFGFGSVQILLTTAAMTLFFMYIMDKDPAVSIVLGAAISLSSTAIVIQVLAESKRQSTQVGRLSIAVLLMQDLAVVPLLAMLPIVSSNAENIALSLSITTLRAVIFVVVITIAGRLFLRPFFTMIGSAKKNEIYVNTALFIVLGAAFVTNRLGLSTAMGAFLAGILIAETEYRDKIEQSIKPFQGLFLAFFFISTGMSIDIPSMNEKFQTVLYISAVIIGVKGFIVFALCRLFKFHVGPAIHSGLLLSQAGEFSFILFGLANQKGILDNDTTQLLLLVVAFTMAVTPLLSLLGKVLEEKLGGAKEPKDINNEFMGVSDLSSHVVVVGFGKIGRTVACILKDKKLNYVGLDANASLVKQARKIGYPVYHGNVSVEMLRSVGIARASYVILTVQDKSLLRRMTKMISVEFSNVTVIAGVEDSKHAIGIRSLGAEVVIPYSIEMGIQLGGALLENIGVPSHEIVHMKDALRQNEYRMIEEIELSRGIHKIQDVVPLYSSQGDGSVADSGGEDGGRVADEMEKQRFAP